VNEHKGDYGYAEVPDPWPLELEMKSSHSVEESYESAQGKNVWKEVPQVLVRSF
jgi:hypothetical protein